MLQCLACEHCRGMLKKIKVFHLHWGKKIQRMFLLILAGVKTPDSAFQALYISAIEGWLVVVEDVG